MKKICLSIIIGLLFIPFLQLNAQTIDVSTSVLSGGLTICGDKKDFQVTITNTGNLPVYNRTLVMSFSESGIYFYNAQSNNTGVALSTDAANGAPTVNVNIQTLDGGAVALISFKAFASCNVAIGATSASINASLLVKENSQTLTSSAFTVNKSINGDLELNTMEASWNQSSNYNKTFTRKYELNNNSAAVFNGYLFFQVVPNS